MSHIFSKDAAGVESGDNNRLGKESLLNFFLTSMLIKCTFT